tara:strand:- start:36990 stop:38291 length:1302 start_codon:yes stop_codon:yes gene_type:complete
MNSQELYSYFLNSTGISIDTRTVEAGNLFFALKGDNFNGNEYAQKALESGASFAIVDEVEYTGTNCILVDDCLKSLQELASFHRDSLSGSIQIFGLTGSNGKTTTKELVYEILKKKYKVKATIGNLNNHIGVPLSLLRIKKGDEIGIIEMGANHQKEIEFLCKICKPDIGYITNFGKAHLEGFGGIEGVIKGKGELYDYLRQNQGLALVNQEDSLQMELSADISRKVFGKENSKSPDFFIEEIANYSSGNSFVKIGLGSQEIQTNLTGHYNFNNISAAIALGLYFNIEQAHIKDALESYFPTNNRSQIEITPKNQLIIDAYNANPSSMEGAINNLQQISAKSKWMILGDMFELGEYEEAEHQKVIEIASKMNFERVIFVGEAFCKSKLPSQKQLYFNSTEALISYLEKELPEDKTILIKGSRGMKLERCIPLL